MPQHANKPALPQFPLDSLIDELQSRLESFRAAGDRVNGLLAATLTIGSDLDLDQVLRRITEAAMELVGARYGALGILGDDGGLKQFIPLGVDEKLIETIGEFPHGKGILGLLIEDPQPIRLADLSTHPRSAGFPAGHPPMRSFLGVPIRIRNKVFGNLYLTEKKHEREFTEYDENLVTALATAAGVAIENARLYEQTRSREQWLSGSMEITQSLLSMRPAEAVLNQIAQEARSIVNSDGVIISVPNGKSDVRIVAVLGANGAEKLPIAEISTVASEILRTGNGTAPYAGPELKRALAAGPITHVPLGHHPVMRGVLTAWRDANRDDFPEPALQMLASFADQAAIVLELDQRRRDAEELTVFQERDRIARNLHDVVIQRLFATGMALESVRRRTDETEIAQRLNTAVNDLDETIREIRTTIFDLQTHQDQFGLRRKILHAIESVTNETSVVPAIVFQGAIETAVSEEIGLHVVAVVTEAVSNAIRHSKSDKVEIEIAASDEVTVTVRDYGIGIASDISRRSGLRHLADRAHQCGGSCTVTTGPTGGTVLTWRAPVSS